MTLPADHIEIKYVGEKGFTDETVKASSVGVAFTDEQKELIDQIIEAQSTEPPLNIPVPPSENRTERMLNRKRNRRATVIDVEMKGGE